MSCKAAPQTHKHTCARDCPAQSTQKVNEKERAAHCQRRTRMGAARRGKPLDDVRNHKRGTKKTRTRTHLTCAAFGEGETGKCVCGGEKEGELCSCPPYTLRGKSGREADQQSVFCVGGGGLEGEVESDVETRFLLLRWKRMR